MQLCAIAKCVGIAVIERIVPSNTAITGTITNIGLFFILCISSGHCSGTWFFNLKISNRCTGIIDCNLPGTFFIFPVFVILRDCYRL